VLLKSSARIETVAIPWLHVIREHPTFLENYTNLFECSRRKPSIIQCLLGSVRAFAIHTRHVARCIQSNGRAFFVTKKVPKSLDYLFVSHLLSSSQISQPYDFYFGDVPEKLAARGFSVAIALINHTSQNESFLVNQIKQTSVSRIIFSHLLSFCNEIELYQRLKKESNRLRAEAACEVDGLDRLVLLRAADEALSGGAFGALRVSWQIGRLVAQTRAKTIVLTHEGHAWERTVIASARKANPSVRCIGYQHAAVFRLQHALRRNLCSEYNPDQILTAGLVGKKQLEASPKLQKIPISVLGSSRAKNPKNKRQAKQKSIPIKNGRDYVCLVLPEGIQTECHHLFNFSIACSKAFPNIKFIWRLHSIVDYKKLCYENYQLKKLPIGIRISNESLEKDFAQSDTVLYRGTTAAVQAVAAGLRPIYLKLKNEMSIDPLYEMRDSVERVSTIGQFGNILKKYKWHYKDTEKDIKLRKYAEKFFTQVDITSMQRASANGSKIINNTRTSSLGQNKYHMTKDAKYFR